MPTLSVLPRSSQVCLTDVRHAARGGPGQSLITARPDRTDGTEQPLASSQTALRSPQTAQDGYIDNGGPVSHSLGHTYSRPLIHCWFNPQPPGGLVRLFTLSLSSRCTEISNCACLILHICSSFGKHKLSCSHDFDFIDLCEVTACHFDRNVLF